MIINNQEKQVLYFEDDQPLSETVIDYLNKQGLQVIHYSQFPQQGLLDIKKRIKAQPELVIIDVGLPGMDGYKICRRLKEEYLEDDVPVLFISGSSSEEDTLKAYDVGANDYLFKPLRLKELGVKIQHYQQYKQDKISQQNIMSNAQKMAFDAMATNSELGEILRFHEQSCLVKNIPELAQLLLTAIAKFSLKSSVLFFSETTDYFRDDGQIKPLEEKTLLAFKDHQRIYSWKNRTFFNYEYFSVLIRDMPINDQEKYGILKDQLCLLFNGIDARVKALKMEKSNQLKALTMKIVADTISNMVMEIECNNVELSQNFENIIFTMEANISADIVTFNLLEEEEKVLLGHIMHATKKSSLIFETSIEKEREYKDIMTNLLKQLHGES